jgi:hypothetical protein
MLQEMLDAELAQRDNDLLDTNGVHDCRVTVGIYSRNGQIVHEARLIGGSDESRVKAKHLLRHITFQD